MRENWCFTSLKDVSQSGNIDVMVEYREIGNFMLKGWTKVSLVLDCNGDCKQSLFSSKMLSLFSLVFQRPLY